MGDEKTTKVIYEKDGVRVVETCWPNGDREPTYVTDVERWTGSDALGVMRWEQVDDRSARILAAAFAGEARNCSRLVQQHHGAVQRSVQLGARVSQLEGVLREALKRGEIATAEQRREILIALGDEDLNEDDEIDNSDDSLEDDQ